MMLISDGLPMSLLSSLKDYISGIHTTLHYTSYSFHFCLYAHDDRVLLLVSKGWSITRAKLHVGERRNLITLISFLVFAYALYTLYVYLLLIRSRSYIARQVIGVFVVGI
jgi:hypothetical protein